VFATSGGVSIQPVDDSKTIRRVLATATGSAARSGTKGDWRPLGAIPPGFRGQTGLHIRGWLPLLSLSYPNAHGARDLPDQAERAEGQASFSRQERSKRRGAPGAKCSAVAPRRGLRGTRGSPPLGASTDRWWTSTVRLVRVDAQNHSKRSTAWWRVTQKSRNCSRTER